MTILGDDFDPSLPFEAKEGRRFPYGTIGEWVPIAPGLSHLAVRVYGILRCHVNRERADDKAYPHQEDIAAMCGVTRRQTISAAVGELVKIGAVDTELVRYARGLRARVFYTVHEAPPSGYAGPVSLKHWYAEYRPERKRDPLLAGEPGSEEEGSAQVSPTCATAHVGESASPPRSARRAPQRTSGGAPCRTFRRAPERTS